MQKIANWVTTDAGTTRTVTLGDDVYTLDLDVPADQLLWETARDFDRQTENVLLEARSLERDCANLIKTVEAHNYTPANPTRSSTVTSLSDAIVRRDLLNTQLVMLRSLRG